MKLFVATTNAGKLRDFRYAAEQLHASHTIEPLPGLADLPEPVEDQDTFEGNARLKACFYSALRPGLWVLADDSGLEVEALEGRPGVRSARLAHDVGAFDKELGLDGSNNAALLLEMTEQTNRSVSYRCALALARDGEIHHVSFGSSDGELLTDPEGSGGFGYDPLFYVPELRQTMAQVSPEDRLRLSHRGRALRAMLTLLPPDLPPDGE